MIQSPKTLEFLQKLKDSGNWNDEYDYSEVDYVNSITKIVIIDKKWNSKHLISPNKILSSNISCKLSNCVNQTDLMVKKFLNIHGSLYDYSKSKYNGNTKEVVITCRKHGDFKKKLNLHLRGQGCVICKGGVKFTEKDAINYINKNYPKKYDLSLFKYKNSKTKLILIDPKYKTKHLMSWASIKKGTECSLINAENKNEYLKLLFIERHGQLYDYSLVKYINENKKVTIICKIHGDFKQTARSHISGSGCPKCQHKGFSKKELIDQLNKVHNNKYDYSKLNYKNQNSKVIIICKDHGEFKQNLNKHKHGAGCRKCAGLDISNDEILKKFYAKHGDKYDYSKVQYESALKKVVIICKKHGEFKQTANNHIYGNGCPTCGLGWNTERIISFITDIRNEDVLEMDPVELNMLITQGKLPKEFEELVFTLEGTKENSLKTLKEKLGIEDDEEISEERSAQLAEDLEKLNPEYSDEMNDAIDAMAPPEFDDLEEIEIEREKRRGLPNISNDDILVLDKELVNSCDDEAVEFFIKYKLRKVWNEVINEKRNPDDIKKLKGGKNSSRLRDLFNEEYKTVINYKPPKGYNFNKKGVVLPPNLMQKLTVNRIKEFKRYGNWSGTGAGKTLSFIIAAREVDARLTVVICLNSTVNQLKEEITGVYPDSLVFDYMKAGQVFDRNKYNFLLLNYEKFQQGYSEEMFQDLNNNNLVDFIVIDEVHNAKQRSKEESIRRGVMMRFIGRSSEMNSNFHLLGMSATPVINNLIEAKSLLKLVTGKQYKDLGTRGTINNALKIFNQLLINGVRNIPKYDIVLNELTGKNTELLNIDGSDSLEELKSNGNKDYLGLEKILLESKLDVIDSFLKPKTIVYTYFTDNDRIPKRIGKYIKKKGYSYDLYIGEYDTDEREKSLKRFIKGDTDILIASRTIGTGVDGLQDVCNRMIILTLPWTDSEYTQLKGRIYRQGSEFGDVDIIIPQVHVQLDNNTNWSWDRQRLQLIRDKRTLADAAVDGIIPSKNLPTREKLCQDSLKALRDWKKRALEGKITMINREDLTLPLRPEIIEYLRPSLGDFSKMNQKWSITRSEKTFKRLQTDPKEWFYYHQMYAEKRKDWDEIPYEVIAKKIDKRPDWIVADMGCGENLLAKEIKNKVHAFDFYSNDDDVVQCDMKNVPLDSDSVDVVVFCLALMAPNYLEHLKEGHRILRTYSKMFICQPYKKMEGKIEKFTSEIEELGFSVEYKTSHQKFVYFDCTKN